MAARLTRFLSFVGIPAATLLGISIVWGQSIASGADLPSLCPAIVHQGDDGLPVITLYPLVGPNVTVPLPGGIKGDITVVAFGTDGKSIYVQRPGEGVWKIEFKPVRRTLLGGTTGLNAWSLTVSRSSDKVFVSGFSARVGCGDFEIDPDATVRTLVAGPAFGCGGAGGVVSPDGKNALGQMGTELSVVDLQSGAARAIKGLKIGSGPSGVIWPGATSWSPDGRWITATTDSNKTILIDAANTSRRRTVAAGNAGVIWSPDSKYLLYSRGQFTCAQFLYFESLEILNVETGKRIVIKSSQCNVIDGFTGWVDPTAVR